MEILLVNNLEILRIIMKNNHQLHHQCFLMLDKRRTMFINLT